VVERSDTTGSVEVWSAHPGGMPAGKVGSVVLQFSRFSLVKSYPPSGILWLGDSGSGGGAALTTG